MDQIESAEYNGFETSNGHTHGDHGWKKVAYPKRNRKQKPAVPNGDNVFRSLEEQAEDRRRRILASKTGAELEDDDEWAERSGRRSNAYGDDSEEETKKPKPKKEKKPKVSLPEAASKIDPSHLEAFLLEASESYASQAEIQLMRFADYFGRALSGASAAHFPWVKMCKESPLS